MSSSTHHTDKQREEVRAAFAELVSGEPKLERCAAFFERFPNAMAQAATLGVLRQTVVAARANKAADADLILFPYEGESSEHYGSYELVSTQHEAVEDCAARKLLLVDDIADAAAVWAGRIGEIELHAANREILCIGNRSHLFLLMGLSTDLRHTIATELSQPDGLPQGLQVVAHSALRKLLAVKVPPLIVLLCPAEGPDDEPQDPWSAIKNFAERDEDKGSACG